jgi:hypothetical protein
MAGRKARGGIGKAEIVYGNKDVIASAKSSKNKPGAIMKEVGGSVVGKKSGGRLDMKARGKSPFSKAGGGSAS